MSASTLNILHSLTDLGPSNTKNKHGVVKHQYLCVCGNTIEREPYLLKDAKSGKRKAIKSCGCYNKAVSSAIHKGRAPHNKHSDRSVYAFNHLFKKYQIWAEKRGYAFCLTKDDFKQIISQNCYYCGVEPSTKVFTDTYSEKNRISSNMLYNGVDRRDNNLGYTIGNCVAACGVCNVMKRDYSLDFFANHIKKIIENERVWKRED